MSTTDKALVSHFQAIAWRDQQLVLLDQRVLPEHETYLTYTRATEVARAIFNMVVRGAPAIGISAAYAVVLSALHHKVIDDNDWRAAIAKDMRLLAASRPTAVNLFWALEQMETILADTGCTRDELVQRLTARAVAIHEQDRQANYAMAEFGAQQIEAGSAVLTHCNAGALATGGYGTALGVIRSAYAQNKLTQVYADETRPWFQGARLTVWELVKDKIPVTLLADSAAAYLMQQNKVQWFIVGADRVAANGDIANKIGTYSAAVNARYHGVKVMVVVPCSTIDMNTANGQQIPVELRSDKELTCYGHQQITTENTETWNPVFDITPAALIDCLVTEKGVIHKPDDQQIAQMMQS